MILSQYGLHLEIERLLVIARIAFHLNYIIQRINSDPAMHNNGVISQCRSQAEL